MSPVTWEELHIFAEVLITFLNSSKALSFYMIWFSKIPKNILRGLEIMCGRVQGPRFNL